MIKKMAALVGAGAFLLVFVVPAFAVNGNWAKKISNEAITAAVSGKNIQGGYVSVYGQKADMDGLMGVVGDNTMTTGKVKARATAKMVVNSSAGGDEGSNGEAENNHAKKIRNSAEATAQSGDNLQGGSVEIEKANVAGGIKVNGNNTLTAKSAHAVSRAFTVINSRWSGFEN